MTWFNYEETPPQYGVEVIGYHPDWVNEDFNPNGTRVGFRDDDGFVSAYWWDEQGEYLTISSNICEEDPYFYENHINNTEPLYWLPIPKFNK